MRKVCKQKIFYTENFHNKKRRAAFVPRGAKLYV